MAFTKTPEGAGSNQTKMVPLVAKWDSRGQYSLEDGIAPDSFMRNAIAEVVKDSANGDVISHAYKRDGSIPFSATFPDAVTGVHLFPDKLSFIATTTANAYKIDLAGATSTTFPGLGDTEPPHWTDYLYDNGTRAVVYGTSTGNIYLYDGVNPPAVVTTGKYDPVFLDGYVFARDNAGNIWNSALNDPTNWPASNFIQSESYPDGISRISRVSSYIVALGDGSIEFYYDAANPTGSPLSLYQGATQHIGYVGGVVEYENSLFFVGSPPEGTLRIYKIEGLKVTPVVDYSSARVMNDFLPQLTPLGPGEKGWGSIVNLNGHSIYTWHVDNSGVGEGRPSISFDLENNLFLELLWGQPQAVGIWQSSGNVTPSTVFALHTVTANDTSHRLYKVEPTSGRDRSDIDYDIEMVLQTKIHDFDTRRNKFGARALLHCDRALVDEDCTLMWSTGDYQSNFYQRGVNLLDPYPAVHALGQFRTILFRVTYLGTSPIRFIGIEVDYDQGSY